MIVVKIKDVGDKGQVTVTLTLRSKSERANNTGYGLVILKHRAICVGDVE